MTALVAMTRIVTARWCGEAWRLIVSLRGTTLRVSSMLPD